jgi:uncharacterized protein YdhG (YjbR/CyaY superfamily)
MTGNEIDAYMAALPTEIRSSMQNLREIIHSTTPDLVESISYKMPVFKYKGRPLAGLAAFTDHCSYFPFSPAVIRSLQKELKPYGTAKGTIHFTISKPLPAALVRKLIAARKAEIEAAAAQKKRA